MPYLGKQPASVPVTADDIPNDSITTAKIVDAAITIADIGPNAVGSSEMADDAVGLNELSATGTTNTSTFLRGDNSWAVPPDNNTVYTHPNHSGEVTSTADGAQVIADNVVDEANLKISNSPTNGQFLSAQSGNTGGLTWATAGSTSASDLTSGTLADARFPATLPAINGSALTNLPSDVEISATVPSSPAQGDLWFNSSASTVSGVSSKSISVYNGTVWAQLNNVTPNASAVESLVIAGGGSGGFDTAGNCGGGGAGGYLYDASFSVGSGALTVTVGGGGSAPTSAHSVGADGSNSVFSSQTAIGGGGGGAYNNISGRTGGSGGGSGQTGSSGGAGTSGQGNAGGSQNGIGGSGGGGAGAAGGAPTQSSQRAGGAGGAGTASSITGSSVTRAGGGGGGSHSTATGTNGAGGSGGGGNGHQGNNNTVATDGSANTGGGGGGGGENKAAGDGGSGVVIIAYSTDYAEATIGGSPTYSYSTSTRSGYHLYIFTAGTGTITF